MKFFETTWKYVRRSPYQAMAAIITMFLTILVSGVFFLISLVSALTLQYFESKPQIIVFFKDTIASEEINSMRSNLEQTGKISEITYVSKDEALQIYQEQNKNDPLLLEMVTADILPASLEVSTTDPKYLQDLIPLIEGNSNVQEVIYQKDVVDKLLTWTGAIRLVGGVLAGLLIVDSLLIITTIIGMKIAMRREEVEILKLVGASPWYIRAPFLWEGGFYGLVGSFVSWGIITGVIVWFRPLLLSFLGTIPLINATLSNPTDPLFLVSMFSFGGALLFLGFFLGCIGSWFAVSRYLKV